MQTALLDLDLSHLWVVYPGTQAYQVDQRISVLPLPKISNLESFVVATLVALCMK